MRKMRRIKRVASNARIPQVPLLWGVWIDDRNGGYWYGNTTRGGVMCWDHDTRKYAQDLAETAGGTVAPYMTLEHVIRANPKQFVQLARLIGKVTGG